MAQEKREQREFARLQFDALTGAGDFTADQIERVLVRVDNQGANTVDNRSMPDICMQHMCAIMLIDGMVTFESAHDEPRMRDPRVLALRGRIELRGDDQLTREVPLRQAIVEIETTDGRSFRQHVRSVRGTAENPMTRAEVDEKAMPLLGHIMGRKRARALCDAVWKIEGLDSVRALRPLLRSRR